MCLDIGDKRIGIAVSDPFNTYALPVETYHRKNLKTDLQKIALYVKEKCATVVVCGLPVNFDGTPSVQTQKAKFFIDSLSQTIGAKIVAVDERCSTVEAEDILIEQNKSREERKSVIDSLASATILNGYLNQINKNKKK